MSAALSWFETFVRDAHLAHMALAVLALEALVVLLLRRRLGGRTVPLLVNVATGAVLMLIVRAALLERPALEIASLFTLALALHLADAALRLRGR